MMEPTKNFAKYVVRRAWSTLHHDKPRKYGLDLLSRNRIINPPSFLVPEGEYKPETVKFSRYDVKVGVMETGHGTYVKPLEPVPCAQFEWTFGFGCGNIGYTTEQVVYVPS